jgi:hypothetical protein
MAHIDPKAKWMEEQLRDGKTLQEIWEVIKRQVGEENDSAN